MGYLKSHPVFSGFSGVGSVSSSAGQISAVILQPLFAELGAGTPFAWILTLVAVLFSALCLSYRVQVQIQANAP